MTTPAPPTATLADFLLARIAEDEVVANAATPGPWHSFKYIVGKGSMEPSEGDIASTWPDPDGVIAAHIAANDPTRVLAECEAKRRIIQRIASEWPPRSSNHRPRHPILRDLAEVYSEHPDYREEWKP